jgi:uncharacterized protein (DUF58 family)
VTAYSNLFFMLLCFQGTLLGSALVAGVVEMRGVKLLFGPVVPVAADQPLPLTVHVVGRRPQASWLELQVSRVWRRLELPGAPDVVGDVAWLPSIGRGLHSVTRARWVTVAPLGMFRTWRYIPPPAPLCVYPTPCRDTAMVLLRESRDDGEVAGMVGRGGSSVSLRDYRSGDERSRIHWKRSARTGTLVVKELEPETTRGWRVVLDGRCDDGAANQERHERALSTLAGLALMARENHLALTVVSQGLRATFAEGRQPTEQLLAWLAAHRPLAMTESPPASEPGALWLGASLTRGSDARPLALDPATRRKSLRELTRAPAFARGAPGQDSPTRHSSLP